MVDVLLQILPIGVGKTAQKIICLQENEFKIAEMEKIFKKILVFYIEFLYNIKGQKHRTGG